MRRLSSFHLGLVAIKKNKKRGMQTIGRASECGCSQVTSKVMISGVRERL